MYNMRKGTTGWNRFASCAPDRITPGKAEMDEQGKIKAYHFNLRVFILAVAAAWTLIIGASLYWNITRVLRTTLEEAVIQARGRVYLAKDAILDKEDFYAMYPRLEEFRKIKRQYDPDHLLRSCQSDRLGLT